MLLLILLAFYLTSNGHNTKNGSSEEDVLMVHGVQGCLYSGNAFWTDSYYEDFGGNIMNQGNAAQITCEWSKAPESRGDGWIAIYPDGEMTISGM